MGRMSITIDDIRHHLEDGSNGYYKNNEEQLFLEDFYKIGFDLKAYDVLDQKIERYPQINFEYDDLKALNLNLLNDNFLYFLNQNQKYEDLLFDIAKDYYDNFLEYSSECKTIFEMVKGTFKKDIKYEDLVEKIDKKIYQLKRIIDVQLRSQEELSNLFDDDISKLLERKYYIRGSLYFNDLMTEIQKLERNTSNFFKNDSFRTLKFLNNAIEKYEDLKVKLLNLEERYGVDLYASDKRSYADMQEKIMYSPNLLEPQNSANEANNFLSLDELLNKISSKMKVPLNKDIYVNFLALNRIDEHFRDISSFRDKIGSLFKN